MNVILPAKVVGGFVAGVLVATGMFYVTSRRVVPEAGGSPGASPAAVRNVAPVAPLVAQAVAEPAAPAIIAKVTEPKPAPRKALVRAKSSARPQPAPEPDPEPVTQPSPEPVPPVVAPEPQPLPAPVVADAWVPSAPVRRAETPKPPPEPRQPQSVIIAHGTELQIRLGEALSSERHKAGDTFIGTLEQPLVADGFVIAERGARVEGRVTQAIPARRGGGQARLVLELTHLHTADNQRVEIRTGPYRREAEHEVKDGLTKVAVGAAIGAAIGAAAGGGKAAGIGAAAGGAAGAGAAVAMKGEPVTFAAESRLMFRLDQPLSITERL